MTRYLLILALAGCAVPQPDPCNESPAGLKRYCGGEVREARRPEIETPDPSPEPPERPREPNRETDPGGWQDWRDHHGNNGHGNDEDGNDSSNPGRSNNGDGTDDDGAPGRAPR